MEPTFSGSGYRLLHLGNPVNRQWAFQLAREASLLRFKIVVCAIAVLLIEGRLDAADYTFHKLFDSTGNQAVLDLLPPQLDAAGGAYFNAEIDGEYDIVRAVPGSYSVVTSGLQFFMAVNDPGDVVTYERLDNATNGRLNLISSGVSSEVPLPTTEPFVLNYAAPGWSQFSTPLINNSLTVGYAGLVPPDLSSPTFALYTSSRPDEALVTTSDAGPMYSAGFFDQLIPANIWMNNQGEIFFSGTGPQGAGIFSVDENGVLTTRLLLADHPELTYLAPQIVANDNGSVLFAALTNDGLGTIGLFELDASNQLHTQSPSLLDPRATYDLNNNGEIAYYREHIKDGIYTGPDAIADKVIETGDVLDGETVTGLRFYRGLNDAGQIAFQAYLGNGRWAVYRADPVAVPEPSTIALASVGTLAVLAHRLRRRRLAKDPQIAQNAA